MAGDGCPLCGAPLQPRQEWCLRCGAAARTRLAASPNWKAPVAALAVVIALALGVLAAALVKLAGSSGGKAQATTTIATPAGATAAGAAAPAATTPTTTAATPLATAPGTPGAGASTAGVGGVAGAVPGARSLGVPKLALPSKAGTHTPGQSGQALTPAQRERIRKGVSTERK
jgi:hypothetical protein